MSRILKHKVAIAITSALILASTSAFAENLIPEGEMEFIPGTDKNLAFNAGPMLSDGTTQAWGQIGTGWCRFISDSLTGDKAGVPEHAPAPNTTNVAYCNHKRTDDNGGIYREVEGLEVGKSYSVTATGATRGSLQFAFEYTKVGAPVVEEVVERTIVDLDNVVVSDLVWVDLADTLTVPADADLTQRFRVFIHTQPSETYSSTDVLETERSLMWVDNLVMTQVGEEPDSDDVVVQGQLFPQDELDVLTAFDTSGDAWSTGTILFGKDGHTGVPLTSTGAQAYVYAGEDNWGEARIINPAMVDPANVRYLDGFDGVYLYLDNWRNKHTDGIGRLVEGIVPDSSYELSARGSTEGSFVWAYRYTKVGEESETVITLTNEALSAGAWVDIDDTFVAPSDIDVAKAFTVYLRTVGDDVGIGGTSAGPMGVDEFSLIPTPVSVEYIPQDELDVLTAFDTSGDAWSTGTILFGKDGHTGVPLTSTGAQAYVYAGEDNWGEARIINPAMVDPGNDRYLDGFDGVYLYLDNWRNKHTDGIGRLVEGIVPDSSYELSARGSTEGSFVWAYRYTKVGEESETVITLTNEALSASAWVDIDDTFVAPSDIDVAKAFTVYLRTVGDDVGIGGTSAGPMGVDEFSLMGPGDEPADELPIVQYIPAGEIDTVSSTGDWPGGTNEVEVTGDLPIETSAGTVPAYAKFDPGFDGTAWGNLYVVVPTATDAGKWWLSPQPYDGGDNYLFQNNYREFHRNGISREIESIIPGGAYVLSADGAVRNQTLVWNYSYTKVGEDVITTVTLDNPVASDGAWVVITEEFTAPSDIDVAKPFKVHLTTVDNDGDADGKIIFTDRNAEVPMWAANFSLMGPGEVVNDDLDGDGVADEVDAFPENAAASVDTDGDGMPDDFLASCDQDCIDNSGLTLDLDDDNDGVLDDVDAFAKNAAASVDTDNDGMPDDFLASCDVDCITSSGLTLDIDDDNDGILDEYDTAPLDNSIGDTEPVFADLAIQSIDARGLLTNIGAEINVVAYDLADGEIMATVVGDTTFESGMHTLQLSAEDSLGNIALAELTVHINPIATLGQSGNVEAGASYQVPVTLSGEAAVYPVTIAYQITGSVVGDSDGELVIEQGTAGVIELNIAGGALGGDMVNISLSDASNAVINSDDTFALTVIDMNITPTLNVAVKQSDNMVSVIDASAGVVTVTATVNDLNSLDTHTISWHVGNSQLVDLNLDNLDSTFEFEPLEAGTFALSVTVAEDNTNELFATTTDLSLVVATELAVLSADNDADNDGISDADEGYADSDHDGILDYLDDDSNPSHLPIGEDTQPMQTITGLQLSLGDIVRSSTGVASIDASIDVNDIASNAGENGSEVDNSVDGHYQTLSTIINFNVSGLSAVGDIVPVVIPLATGKYIPEEAVYRKYTEAAGWFDFVVDSRNNVSTALKDADGNCPAPLSFAYRVTIDGLNVGDDCIQLLIEDGGPNDADGQANGIVKDPGVLATEVHNQAPVITLVDSSVKEMSDIVIESIVTDAENDSISYLWEQVGGETVVLVDPTSSSLAFTSPVFDDEAADLSFMLTANDGTAETSEIITLTVMYLNKSPTVTVASESSYTEGEKVTITATASDIEEDDLRYVWTQLSGPTLTLTGQAIATSEGSTQTIHFTVPNISTDNTIELQLTVYGGENETSQIITFEINERSSGGSMAWLLVFLGLTAFNRRANKKGALSKD